MTPPVWCKGQGYSRLPHNPYTSVDCSGYGVSGSMDSKKRSNKGQTNKILFENPEKRSEDRYTMLLLLRLPECVTMRVESLSRRLDIIFFFLLLLINDGIQSSCKFSWSCMPQFCYFWSPFVYKAISHHFLSSFGQFSCEFYPKLSEIKPQYLWVLPPEWYGL